MLFFEDIFTFTMQNKKEFNVDLARKLDHLLLLGTSAPFLCHTIF